MSIEASRAEPAVILGSRRWAPALADLRRVARRAARLAVWLSALFVLVVFTPISWYIGAPLRVATEPRPSDAIALFASGQIDDNWVTADAAQRLLGALDLYRRHFGRVIITSGSQHERDLFQAELLASWLRRADVPQQDLLVENRSRRTYESVVELRRLMAAHGWRSVVIVTSQMDVPRISLICAHFGMNVSFFAVPAERPPNPGSLLYLSDGYPALYHALYEYAGLAFYRLRGWI